MCSISGRIWSHRREFTDWQEYKEQNGNYTRFFSVIYVIIITCCQILIESGVYHAADCRLPTADCRLPKIIFWWFVTILVFSVGSAAKAAVICSQYSYTDKKEVFEVSLPDNFDAVPNGSIVSRGWKEEFRISCGAATGDNVRLSVGGIPGTKVVNQAVLDFFYHGSSCIGEVVYTTPELEARGLGYCFSKFNINVYIKTTQDNNLKSFYGVSGSWFNPVTGIQTSWLAVPPELNGYPRNGGDIMYIGGMAEFIFIKLAIPVSMPRCRRIFRQY